MPAFELSYANRETVREKSGSFVHEQAIILLSKIEALAYELDLVRSCDYGETFRAAMADALRRGAEKVAKSERPRANDQAGVWRAVADLFDPAGGEMPKLIAEVDKMRAELAGSGLDPDATLAKLREPAPQNETGEKSQEI